MPTLDQTMINVLSSLVQSLPIGTNLGLFRFLWMLCSGRLLNSRGALFPALLALGLSDAEVRRAWAAFRYGSWTMAPLLLGWKTYVETEEVWQARRHGGYRVRAVDITAFWRPKLKNCPSKHFHALAGRALPAVIVGMVAQVGQVGSQRVALMTGVKPPCKPICCVRWGLIWKTTRSPYLTRGFTCSSYRLWGCRAISCDWRAT